MTQLSIASGTHRKSPGAIGVEAGVPVPAAAVEGEVPGKGGTLSFT